MTCKIDELRTFLDGSDLRQVAWDLGRDPDEMRTLYEDFGPGIEAESNAAFVTAALAEIDAAGVSYEDYLSATGRHEGVVGSRRALRRLERIRVRMTEGPSEWASGERLPHDVVEGRDEPKEDDEDDPMRPDDVAPWAGGFSGTNIAGVEW